MNNAQRFLDVQEAFGSFDAYIWRFVDGKPIVNRWKSLKQVPASTQASDALSKDLKAARLQVRRLHHLLRPHAGHRHGQRPSRRLLPAWGNHP
jgi:hypothetical protein